MPPTFEMSAVARCHDCGREREQPSEGEAETLMRGDEVIVLKARDACEQCGGERLAIRFDFGVSD